MTERSYTVKEIDRMRDAVRSIIAWKDGGGGAITVENSLRTHMVAGVSPEELELKARESYENSPLRERKGVERRR
jgi:hypothetical protein